MCDHIETEAGQNKTYLNWFEIWRAAFLHPTIETYTKIINDPKASMRWGIFWMALMTFLLWFAGPQSGLWRGIIIVQFGPQTASYFMAIGAIAVPIMGVFSLLFIAAISHGFALLFNGKGILRQLVYCWGVMQVPFIFISFLGFSLLPNIYTAARLVFSIELSYAILGLITLASAFIALVVVLYLIYAEMVAFCAVEKVHIGKGFWILLLSGIVVGTISGGLSVGFRFILMKSLGY